MEIKYKVKKNFYTDTNKNVLLLSLDEIEKSNITTYSEFYEGKDYVKPYFDFDIENVKDKDTYNKIRKKIKKEYYNEIKDISLDILDDDFIKDNRITPVINVDIAISESSYFNDDNNSKTVFFDYYQGLDISVYRNEHKTGNMRMINMNKPNKLIKLKPINYKDDITKHIIQHITDGITEYNFISINVEETNKINNNDLISNKGTLYEKNTVLLSGM